MRYNDVEIDISNTNYVENAVTMLLPDGTIVCIPEQDATLDELAIINEIKADVALRPVLEVIPSDPIPTLEDRVSGVETEVADISQTIDVLFGGTTV